MFATTMRETRTQDKPDSFCPMCGAKSLIFKNETMIVGLLGTTTIISYSSFMVSHVVLAHQHSILFMLYTLTIFASIISNRINYKDKI